jgi:colanic acid biosynthesis glycosyl transferase WcaI
VSRAAGVSRRAWLRAAPEAVPEAAAAPGRAAGQGALSVPAARWAAARAAAARPLRVLVLGMNYAPEPVGVALYTAGLAEGLAAAGHSVSVVAATPWYPAWAPLAGHGRGWSRSWEAGVEVVRCPHPIPRRPRLAARLAQQAAWGAAALPPLLARARRMRPDVVLATAPALLAAPAALLAARIGGARSWLHVQDFEVEAAAGLLGGSRAGRAALAAERGLLARFDRVSSISPAMCARLADKGVDPARVRELRNWAELDAIRPLEGPSRYRAEWGLEGRRVALYSGNIGAKQGLPLVLEAARRLQGRPGLEDLTFVICGEGPNMARLQAMARDLSNVMFRPLQPFERLGELLGLADIHLMPQRAGAADLVLPSKLANMLASGRPVAATAAEGTQLAAEVAGCGLTCPPEDAGALAETVAALAAAPRMREALGRAGRARAVARWDRAGVIAGAETELRALVAEAAAPEYAAAAARAAGGARAARAEAAADAALAAEAGRAAEARARAAVLAEAAGDGAPPARAASG